MTRARWLIGLAVVLAAALAGIVIRALAPDPRGAQVIRWTIDSRQVGAVLPVVGIIPPHSTGVGRPLLVFLHGRGGDGQNANLNDAMFAALAAQGPAAPDIVFPNGGDASYWHNRTGGRWADYVTREVIPTALTRLHADRHRVAIGGISMGGFGALDLGRSAPGRFCAIGATSAALWFAGADSAAGAFDDAADFARHDVLAVAARKDPYGRTPVWIDVGASDPFHTADFTLAARLRAQGANVSFHVWPGDHDGAYWAAHWRDTMRFYAAALSHCGR
jgi:S-formylglutathione hydrolase FrmB